MQERSPPRPTCLPPQTKSTSTKGGKGGGNGWTVATCTPRRSCRSRKRCYSQWPTVAAHTARFAPPHVQTAYFQCYTCRPSFMYST